MTEIAVKVQPNAKKNEVVGFLDGVLRVRVAAPPAEGKANKALVSFLAKSLGLREREVVILKGVKARDKVIGVDGLSREEVVGWLVGNKSPL